VKTSINLVDISFNVNEPTGIVALYLMFDRAFRW